MEIKIKNIGLIEDATISLDGLSVLTGLNGSGKSTVGLSLYALFNSSKYALDDVILKATYENSAIEIIDDLYNDFVFSLMKNNKESSISLGRNGNFDSNEFILETEGLFIELINAVDSIQREPKDKKINIIADFIENLWLEFDKKFRLKISQIVVMQNNMAVIEEKLVPILAENFKKNFLELLNETTNISFRFNKAIIGLFNSIFHNKIRNELNPTGTSEVSVCEGESLFFVQNLSDNVLQDQDFDSLRELVFRKYADVTFIDSPIIMAYSEYFTDRGRLVRRFTFNKRTPVIDIFEKLKFAKDISTLQENWIENILPKISEVIQGGAKFDPMKDSFYFQNNKGSSYHIFNTASGIKSFAIIQLLLQNGYINRNSLLVIDEPENHLHPEWQLKFAEILVLLVDAGVPVIVSTHSPYMLVALEKKVIQHSIKDKAHFYLGEMTGTGAIFKDVTENLQPIHELLSQPMNELLYS